MSVAEMRILRWMRNKTRKDKIRNSNICDMVGVALIEDKLRENRLRSLGLKGSIPKNRSVILKKFIFKS